MEIWFDVYMFKGYKSFLLITIVLEKIGIVVTVVLL